MRRSSRRLGSLEREILYEVSGTDALVGFLLSGRSTKAMFKTARDRAKSRYRKKLAIERLEKYGYVARRGEYVSISTEGIKALERLAENTRDLLKSAQWDGKWRIVTFDIPESKRYLRQEVRAILIRAGFVKLHHSVWIFPHACDELAAFIRKEASLDRYVLYGVLEKVDGDRQLRRQFKLD